MSSVLDFALDPGHPTHRSGIPPALEEVLGWECVERAIVEMEHTPEDQEPQRWAVDVLLLVKDAYPQGYQVPSELLRVLDIGRRG